MDLATIIGIALSTLLVLASIFMGGSPIMFVNVPSMLVVIGGTIGTTLVRNPLSAVLGTFGVAAKAFTTKVPAPEQLISEVLELSRTARKELLALEKAVISYPFLAKGISLCVDAVEVERIRMVLENDIRSTASRHKRGQQVLEGMGEAAPAFGMIGTLIGLVQMLAVLDDPSSIGPAMALALLTTLYGALIANVLCLPLADKLKVRSEQEVLSMTLCLEGAIAIAERSNPSAIGRQLNVFISPKLRKEDAKAA